ncbi:MAG: glycosyltransferase family 2 protein, partial [Bacteroidia bacterium]|nr:glycosyltransferase family 2 protein [Bacteroidia bacterium]
MNKPFVSICIPSYNGALYLSACIDSCIGQTYTNYEIIICDDGSTDNTLSIVEEYLKKSDKIRLLKNPQNIGLVGNWNKCIQEAKGEWVKFIFQDDYMEPDCLQKFVEAIKEDIYLVVCKRNFIIEKKATEDELDYYQRRVKTLENTGCFNSVNFKAQTISKIAANHISLNFIAEPSLSFIKKQVINKVGYFDSDLKQICDLEYLLRIASVYGLTYIPE